MPDGSAIRAMFAGISGRYDLLNRILSLGIDRGWRRRTVEAVAGPGERAPRRIVDLCCGTGDLSLALASRGLSVTGVDFCHEMLLLGRRKAAPLGEGAPRMIEADALALPFADGLYDGATVAFGVRNLENLDRGLAEAARILRSGGILAVLEFASARGPLLKVLYRLYLNGLVPLVGRMLTRDGGAYGYLSSSIQAFEDQSTFPPRLRRAGFTSVNCTELTGGIAALYTAVKP